MRNEKRKKPHRGNGDPHRGNGDFNSTNGDGVSLVRKKRYEQKSRPQSREKPPNADFVFKVGRQTGTQMLHKGVGTN